MQLPATCEETHVLIAEHVRLLQASLTYEKLESALTYVQRLLSEFVSGIDAIDIAGADRQWRQLRSLQICLIPAVVPNETLQLDQPSGAFQPAQTCLDDPDRLDRSKLLSKRKGDEFCEGCET